MVLLVMKVEIKMFSCWFEELSVWDISYCGLCFKCYLFFRKLVIVMLKLDKI